jgi:hypothetical protein
MASNYPAGLDTFATNRVTGQTIAAATDNDHSDAINKIEAELGTNPSGAEATIAARLAAIETGVIVPAGSSQAATQAIVTAASVAGNAAVMFEDGTYSWASPVTIPNFMQLVGQGQNTVLRASGNNYVLSLSPGNRSAIRNLMIDAASGQSSGGGIDFTSAGSNVFVEHVYFGSNLFIGLNVAPAAGGAVYIFRALRWNGVTGCTTGIVLGGGSSNATDIYFSDVIGTASTTSDMDTWVSLPTTADTVKFRSALFIKGSVGFSVGSTGQITNTKLTDVTLDTLTGKALDIVRAREFSCGGVEISTCGAANVPALDVGANSKGFRFSNGVIQGCAGYGAIIRNASTHTLISDSIVTDCNSTNTAANDGIAVAAGASHFKIVNNTIGNDVLLGPPSTDGHQKTGISVAAGASDYYTITGNTCSGNETSNNVVDNGTGSNKAVRDNLPRTVPAIASAATITVPSYAVMVTVTGTTGITTITSSWPHRIITLRFTDAAPGTVTDGRNLNLAGDFAPTQHDTLTLVSDGANWHEIGRAVV